ncbi:MAG: nuclear transport factor 2 family protein [Nocardioides sp.]
MEHDPVERQLRAYNRRDLDEFLACYAADACIRDGRGGTLLSGHAEMRARYGSVFERHPELHASVNGRLQAGEWTVDEEQVVLDGVPLHLLVAYRVEAGLIRDVVMLRADSI